MSDTQPELFHSIAQAESGVVRRFIVDHDLAERIRFRNITYPEVQADFTARGGTTTPALWDGAKLIEGAEAVLAALSAL